MMNRRDHSAGSGSTARRIFDRKDGLGAGGSTLWTLAEGAMNGRRLHVGAARALVVLLALVVGVMWAQPAAAQIGGGLGTAGPETMRRIGAWGGPVHAVAINEARQLAFTGSGRRIVVLDISDKMNPEEVGSVLMPETVLDLRLHPADSNYLYCGTHGNIGFLNPPELPPLSVVNVSDPTRPFIVKRVVPGHFWDLAHKIQFYNQMAFVIRGLGVRRQIQIFLATNPANPISLDPHGTVASKDPPGVHDFVIQGDRCYVLNSTDRSLDIYDLTPAPWGDCPLLGDVHFHPNSTVLSLDVEGNYACVTLARSDQSYPDGRMMVVIDISDPESPFITGEFSDLLWPEKVALSDGVAYIADNASSPTWDGNFQVPRWELASGLVVLDVAGSPTAPKLLATRRTHGSTAGVAAFGDLVCTFDDGEGLIFWDMMLPFDPVRLGHYHSPNRLRKIARSGDLIYVTDQWNGFTVLDIADPTKPAVVGVYQTPLAGYAGHWGIVIRDDLAYFGAGMSGLEIVDVSDPENPTFLNRFDAPPNYAGAILLDGPYAYVGLTPPLRTFNISDPQNIVELSQVPQMSSTQKIKKLDGAPIAYVARNNLGAVLDLSDPENPVRIGPFDSIQAVDCDVRGNLVYVADNNSDGGGLSIRDLSDPASPLEVWRFPANFGTTVALDGNRLYFVGTDGGRDFLFHFDVTNPAQPVLISRLRFPGAIGTVGGGASLDSGRDLFPNGNILLMTTANGFEIVEVGPTRPHSITPFDR